MINSCLPGDFVLRRSACCQTARFRPEVQSSAEPGSNVEQLSLLPDTHDVHQVSAMLDGSCVGIVSADVLAPSTGLKSDFQLHEPHDAVHISRTTDPKEERLVLVSFPHSAKLFFLHVVHFDDPSDDAVPSKQQARMLVIPVATLNPANHTLDSAPYGTGEYYPEVQVQPHDHIHLVPHKSARGIEVVPVYSESALCLSGNFGQEYVYVWTVDLCVRACACACVAYCIAVMYRTVLYCIALGCMALLVLYLYFVPHRNVSCCMCVYVYQHAMRARQRSPSA